MESKELVLTPKRQLIILVFIALALNLNTLFNQYAVDDEEVLTKNSLVAKGIKGIPKILTTDLLHGTLDADNSLSQARYRPFTLVVFALEYQFFGANPFVSHLINILLFGLLIILLFKLMQIIFRERNHHLAFYTCLIFTVHPIHTEVIANVKSRDEIITFILLVISLINIIKHSEKHSNVSIIFGLICFFLALLTRESAVTFIAVVPLVLFYFYKYSIKKALLFSLPLIAVIISYLILRAVIVGFSQPALGSIMDNPFLYATSTEAFATKIFITLKYILLLIFPYPLSCDYGFNQIPYVSILSIQFIFSFLLLLCLITFASVTFRKKSIITFSIIYFIITISLTTNILVDIGTPLSERLLFQPSLAFCILLGLLYLKTVSRFRLIANTILSVILILFSLKTFSRNFEWKNNQTLYFADAVSAPNSVRTNLYAAINYVLKANDETDNKLQIQDYNKAVLYGERSLAIFHNYPDTYIVLGDAYLGIHDYFKAADNLLLADNFISSKPLVKERVNRLSSVLQNEGYKFYAQHKINDALQCFQKSVELNYNNVESWYNLGGIYFSINNTKNGNEAWQNVVILSPNHKMNKEDFEK